MKDERVTFEPAQAYERPFDVLKDMTLSPDEKIEILRQWLADAVGMPADEADGASRSDRISAVAKALQFLGAPVEVA